jgi:hypothetical protein
VDDVCVQSKRGWSEHAWHAVQKRMDRVLVYNGAEHDFDGRHLWPLAVPPRPARPSKLRWNLPEGYEPVNGDAYYVLWQGVDEDCAARARELAAARAAAYVQAPPASPEGTVATRQGLRVQ